MAPLHSLHFHCTGFLDVVSLLATASLSLLVVMVVVVTALLPGGRMMAHVVRSQLATLNTRHNKTIAKGELTRAPSLSHTSRGPARHL